MSQDDKFEGIEREREYVAGIIKGIYSSLFSWEEET